MLAVNFVSETNSQVPLPYQDPVIIVGAQLQPAGVARLSNPNEDTSLEQRRLRLLELLQTLEELSHFSKSPEEIFQLKVGTRFYRFAKSLFKTIEYAFIKVLPDGCRFLSAVGNIVRHDDLPDIVNISGIGIGGKKKKVPKTPNLAQQVANLTKKVKNVKIAAISSVPRSVKRGGGFSEKNNSNAYYQAIRDPFHPAAEGCRIPDNYAFPTATYKLKGTISVVSPNGVTAGGIALLPHPVISYIDLSGGVFTGAAFTGSTSMSQYSVSTSIYGATNPTNLAGVLTTYRVVACGWKVRVQMQELDRTGRLMFAPIPMARDMPGYNALNLQVPTPTSAAASRILAGLSAPVAVSSAILGLPGAQEWSLPDMGAKDVLLISKPCAPNSKTFHTAIGGIGYNAAYNSGETTLSTPAGVFYTADSSDLLDASGLTGYLLHFEGTPNSTKPVIDIEYIYHLEGTPIITSATTFPIPSGNVVGVVAPALYDRAVELAAKLPWGRMIDAGLANFGVSSSLGAKVESGYKMIKNF